MLVQNQESYLKVSYYVIRACACEKKVETVSYFLWRANALIKNVPISNQENVNKNKKMLLPEINPRAHENSFNGNPALYSMRFYSWCSIPASLSQVNSGSQFVLPLCGLVQN